MTKATKTKHAVTWLTAATMTGGVLALQTEQAMLPKPTVTADPVVVKVQVTKAPTPTKITKTVPVPQRPSGGSSNNSSNNSSGNNGTSGGSK